MVDVPEHLAPRDGLTNSAFELSGLEVLKGGNVRVSFCTNSKSGEKEHILSVVIEADVERNTDQVIAEAFQVAIDHLRQWIHRAEVYRKAYEDRGSR